MILDDNIEFISLQESCFVADPASEAVAVSARAVEFDLDHFLRALCVVE
jgi:hypothetical protein